MKRLKAMTALLLSTSLLLTAASCGGNKGKETSGDAPAASQDPGNQSAQEMAVPEGTVKDGKRVYTLAENVAAIHGRFTKEKHADTDTYTFTHGAAGIDINFTGTDFWINLPEVPTEDKDGVTTVRKVGISVLIDSEMPMDAVMYDPEQAGWLQVASGLSEGEHHIRIRKRDRGFFGVMASDWFAVSEIATNEGGKITAPDKLSDLVIEVYGDSISNGDAVWLNENGTNSAYTNGNWTGVLERLLNAEVRVTGNTGNGLLGWVFPEKNGKLDNLLPPQNNWDKIDPQHGGGTWDHTGDNAADVVIINLGTNDRGELGNGDLTHKAFADEYVRFIKQIKTDCPDAIVICTIGAMGGTQEWSETLGGEGMDYIEYEWQDGEITRSIAEGKMIEGLLGANVATTGKPFDSGVGLYSGDMNAAFINDANLTTGWQPKNVGDMGKNCYVGMTFDHAVKMTGVTVTWEDGTRAVASTDGYRVEVTTDGKNWSVPAGISYNYGTGTDAVTFGEIAAKGVRVVTLKSTSEKYASKIYEIEVASDEKAAALINENEIKHFDSVIDQCNAWAGKTFCYFVEIQKCDTMDGGAGFDNGHPSNLAGEVYGLQYATLINKVLGLGIELPTDIPAYAYEKKLGTAAPEGSILDAIKANENTLSYIDEVIARAKKEQN